MNKTVRRISASLLIALFIFGIAFIKCSNNDLGTVQAANFEWGTVKVASGGKLSVRASASTYAKVVTACKTGQKVKIARSTLGKTWVKIAVGGKKGYVYGKYILTAYGTATQPYKNIRKGTTAVALYIRNLPKAGAAKLKVVPRGKTLQVLTSASTWVKVKYDGVVGYTQGVKINCANGKTAAGTAIVTRPTSTSTKGKGEAVIAFAKNFIGNRYVYGGNSLTNGTDCSGFVHLIYQHFGYNISRQSYALRSDGYAVSSLSQAQPGDIICYDGHVALYMGNGQIIHASNSAPYPQGGIKVSPDATYRTIVAIRRIVR